MRLFIYSFFFLFVVCNVNAQQTQKDTTPSSVKGTLENQFDNVIQKSTNYQEYKVVKKEQLDMLKKNSVDSVAKFKIELNKLKGEFATHGTVVSGLKDSLSVVQVELNELKTAQNNVDFLGSPISKTNYNLIMWGIVTVLFLIVIISIFQLKNAKSTSKTATSEFSKLEVEFEDFKRKSLEKEQKLGRQLQDEINKQAKPKK